MGSPSTPARTLDVPKRVRAERAEHAQSGCATMEREKIMDNEEPRICDSFQAARGKSKETTQASAPAPKSNTPYGEIVKRARARGGHQDTCNEEQLLKKSVGN